MNFCLLYYYFYFVISFFQDLYVTLVAASFADKWNPNKAFISNCCWFPYYKILRSAIWTGDQQSFHKKIKKSLGPCFSEVYEMSPNCRRANVERQDRNSKEGYCSYYCSDCHYLPVGSQYERNHQYTAYSSANVHQ